MVDRIDYLHFLCLRLSSLRFIVLDILYHRLFTASYCRNFLLKNTYYDESVAMRLLANHGQWELLIHLAKVSSTVKYV